MSFRRFLEELTNREEILSLRIGSEIKSVRGADFHRGISRWSVQLSHLAESSLVLIALEHSDDLIFSFFACLRMNLIPAYCAHPSAKVDPRDFTSKLEALVKTHQPHALVIDSHFTDLTTKLSRSLEVIIPVEPATLPIEREIPINPNFAQFSSGSTGVPKGILYRWNQLEQHVGEFSKTLRLQPHHRFISWLPLYHDMGLIACLMTPLIHQNHIHLISPFEWISNPRLLFQDSSQFQSTHSWMPNFAFQLLKAKVPAANLDLSSFQCLSSCAEPVDAQVVKDFYKHFNQAGLNPHCLGSTYAMAENIFAMTHRQFDLSTDSWYLSLNESAYQNERIEFQDHSRRQVVSCGPPLASVDLKISAESSMIGEILIRSPYTVDSYWHRDAEILDKEGFFNTGDRGFLHEGELYVTGRSSDLIIHRGINLYPQDVEAILNQIEGLYRGRNVVFGVYNQETGTEDVIALAEVLPCTDTTVLIDEVYEKIAHHFDFTPSDIRLLPHMWLRKTSSGKISRNLNRKKYLDYQQKEIHIVGCSHVYSFNESEELYNQHTTAKNIFLKQIPIVSSENIHREPRNQEFRNYIQSLPEGSLALFLFGEQDIRSVIPFLMRHRNHGLDEAVESVILSYQIMEKEILERRPDLLCGWILPPPPGEGLKPHPRFLASEELTDEVYYHFLGTQEERRVFASALATSMKDSMSFPVLDIWPQVLKDPNSLEIQEKFIRDNSHLKNVKELYEREIQRQFGVLVKPTKTQVQNLEKSELNNENIEEEMIRLLKAHFRFKPARDSNILNRLNSLDIVELLSLLQDKYKLNLPPTWTNKNEIETLSKLCRWVLSHREHS